MQLTVGHLCHADAQMKLCMLVIHSTASRELTCLPEYDAEDPSGIDGP